MTTNYTIDDWVTISEAQAILNVSFMTIYRRIKDGSISIVHVGNKPLLLKTDVEKLKKDGGTCPAG